MSKGWVVLTKRYGEDIRNPTAVDLEKAVAELYHENLPKMTQSDFEEHGAGFLRYGVDDGPMMVIEIVRNGKVVLEEWADPDYATPLCAAREMNDVTENVALDLWRWLSEGLMDKVRSQAWHGAE